MLDHGSPSWQQAVTLTLKIHAGLLQVNVTHTRNHLNLVHKKLHILNININFQEILFIQKKQSS